MMELFIVKQIFYICIKILTTISLRIRQLCNSVQILAHHAACYHSYIWL